MWVEVEYTGEDFNFSQEVWYPEDEPYDPKWYPDSPYDVPYTWLLACVAGTAGNGVLMASVLKKNIKDPCLINLIAGNILAMLCLPFNYIHHFNSGWQLGSSTCKFFWICRDIAVGVQIFSVALLSIVLFTNLTTSRNNYEPFPSEPDSSDNPKNTDILIVGRKSKLSAYAQTFFIWILALSCSLPRVILSDESCSVHTGDIFESIYVKDIVTFHCLALCIVPLVVTIFFYMTTAYRLRSLTNQSFMQNRECKLVLAFIIVIIINYIPQYIWLLYAWKKHKFLTKIFVDFALYFPLYTTACWIPLAVYYVSS